MPLTPSDLLAPLYNGVPQCIDVMTKKQLQFEQQSEAHIQPQITLPKLICQNSPLLLILNHPEPPSMNPPQVTCDEINMSSDDDSSKVSNDMSNETSMDLDDSNDSSSNSSSLFATLSKSKIARMEKI